MANVQIILPAMGEGIIEAEVTRWLVTEGSPVKADDPLVEVATDKVDSEIPAPENGILHKILVSEGEVPKIGQVLAVLKTGKNGSGEDEPPDEDVTHDPGIKEAIPEISPSVTEEQDSQSTLLPGVNLAGMAFLSPLLRKMARENELTPAEISRIPGTGMAGRITRQDMEKFLKDRMMGPVKAEEPVQIPAERTPAKPAASEATKEHGADQSWTYIELSRMRQKIAEHMVLSRDTAPHVTSFAAADVTVLMTWREGVKEVFLRKYGQRLTFTTLVIEAVAGALRDFPGINVSLEGNTLIRKKEINIGMATALPDGNLIVPVIRKADTMNLRGLAAAVNDLAERARTNDLKPEEIKGSTFTITNIGSTGNIAGTPIINQPESAILAVGSVRKSPAVVETPDGDAIGIRWIVILSLAYDHRIIDGVLGGSFLTRIGDNLQQFDGKRFI